VKLKKNIQPVESTHGGGRFRVHYCGSEDMVQGESGHICVQWLY
jgi:hypothetical protein